MTAEQEHASWCPFSGRIHDPEHVCWRASTAETDQLEVVSCNAQGIDHEPHVIDFSAIDSPLRNLGPWQCPGWPEPSYSPEPKEAGRD